VQKQQNGRGVESDEEIRKNKLFKAATSQPFMTFTPAP